MEKNGRIFMKQKRHAWMDTDVRTALYASWTGFFFGISYVIDGCISVKSSQEICGAQAEVIMPVLVMIVAVFMGQGVREKFDRVLMRHGRACTRTALLVLLSTDLYLLLYAGAVVFNERFAQAYDYLAQKMFIMAALCALASAVLWRRGKKYAH